MGAALWRSILSQLWAWASASGLVAFGLGKMQNLPLLELYLSTLGATAFFSVAWIAWSLDRRSNSAKYKLAIEGAPAWLCERDGVQKLVPRINLINMAPFPVHYDVSGFEWSQNGRSGDNSTTAQATGIIGPRGSGYVTGPVFQEEYKIGDMVTVMLKIKLKYGKNNPRECSITGDFGMIIGQDADRGPQFALQQSGEVKYI